MDKDKKNKTTIVIVDDNKNVGESLKWVLNEEGYMVDTLTDGYELFAYMKGKRANLILLDIMMPEKDGLEILSGIKSEWPDTKVIIYSGHQQYEYSAYTRKADMFILKGGSPKTLLDAIEKLLK
jgi:two-component system, OmpR family, response regulator ResD